MSQSKGKLIVAVLTFVVLAMSSLACGSSDAPGASAAKTLTQEELDALWDAQSGEYWEEANAKEEIRGEAIKRDAVVVEWRGDWDSNTRLALFRGQGHVSDVTVGTQYMDLVERDQITLKEYDEEGKFWFAVANISNNLQPGGKIVFVR